MHRWFALTLAVLVTGSFSALADDRPDPAKTPGAILGTVPDDQVASCLLDKTGTNVQVDDAITVELICTPGYSKCIRNVPQAEKMAVYQSYGLAGNHTGYCDTKQGCEIDHLISLELGGSNEQTNLWPEPYQGTEWNAHVKDQLRTSCTHTSAPATFRWIKPSRKSPQTGSHPTRSVLVITDCQHRRNWR